MLNRVPQNFIAVIMKGKLGKNEYPDLRIFFEMMSSFVILQTIG